MPGAAVAITKVTEERPIGPDGKVVPEVVVTFTVGSHGPFTERFRKDAFDSNAVNQQLTTFAQKLAGLPGIT